MKLFGELPKFPVALPDDELRLLAILPQWDTTQEIRQGEESAARRLEKRGLIKISREKDDPISIRRTMYAGRLASSNIAALSPAPSNSKTGDTES